MIRDELRSNVQYFSDGVCRIYSLVDGGYDSKGKPKKALRLKGSLRYNEMTVGIARYDRGKARDVEITRVLRTPRKLDVSSQDICEDNGVQFRIDQIQYPKEAVPACMDLSLVKVAHNYETA